MKVLSIRELKKAEEILRHYFPQSEEVCKPHFIIIVSVRYSLSVFSIVPLIFFFFIIRLQKSIFQFFNLFVSLEIYCDITTQRFSMHCKITYKVYLIDTPDESCKRLFSTILLRFDKAVNFALEEKK